MMQPPLPEFPFSILAVAPFAAQTRTKSVPLETDPLDINQALTAVAPSFFLSLPTKYCPAGGLQLSFRKMRDFTPDGLLQCHPYLQDLLQADHYCRKAKQEGLSPESILAGLKQYPALPSVHLGKQGEEKRNNTETSNALDAILSMVDVPDNQSVAQQETSGEAESYAEIAERILSCIYADPAFRTLESCWQGLRFLGRSLAKTEGRLSILSGTAENIDDLLTDIRDSIISSPPSLLLVDHCFSSSAVSVQLMTSLADFGREMLVPVAASVDAAFLGISHWQELNTLSFLPHLLEGAPFAKFDRLRKSSAGRWLSLSCFRFLTRFPYEPENRSRLLPFYEGTPLWISPVWAVSAIMALRNSQCGWAAGFSLPHPLLLEDLALNLQESAGQTPLEILPDTDRLGQLARCGIMPLTGWKGKDTAFLAADVTVSADTSLSYQMLVCRVSHWILWCRDHWQVDFQPEELADSLRTAFFAFSQKQHPIPAGDVQVKCREEEQCIRVFFRWTPSHRILPDAQEVVLDFIW